MGGKQMEGKASHLLLPLPHITSPKPTTDSPNASAMNFLRWTRRPPAPPTLSPETVLSHLRGRTPAPTSAVLSAVLTLLSSSTTPTTTLSALLSALHALPPHQIPASMAVALAAAIADAAHHATPPLPPAALLHSLALVAQLAATSDAAARAIAPAIAPRLLHRALPRPALRDPARRLAVACGIRADDFRALLAAAHGSLRGRAGMFVAAAAARYARPVRILALDGGGTRAVLALQVLKRVEQLTGRRIRESFDLIAGTSTGGVLAVAIGLLGMSLGDCEELYKRCAREVFTMRGGPPGKTASSGIYHAGKVLLLNRGMYDTRALTRIYEKECGEQRFFEHAAGNGTPRVFVLSTQIRAKDARVETPRPYLHANYQLPAEKGRPPRYSHGGLHKLSEGLRATTAAPVYFDPFTDAAGEVFCDGAVLVNNPTSVAIHEARCLWPERPLGVVVSVGTGLFRESGEEVALQKSEQRVREGTGDGAGGEAKVRREWGGGLAFRIAQAVLESATDTEGVHHTLEDLIERDDVYFRLNPEVDGERILLDEYRGEVLERLGRIGREYAGGGGDGAKKIARLCERLKALAKPGLPAYGMWRPKAAHSYARL